jgi:nucleotide-binding universal stress UspA family protein
MPGERASGDAVHAASFAARCTTGPTLRISSCIVAPRRLDSDRGAAATANEGSTDRRADRHTTAADIGFDRPDKLVLGNLAAVAVPQAHAAADPSCTVRCRPDDARRRHLRFEERDPPFELRLLLEQVEQQRIVGIALLAHVAELLPHLPAAYSPQRLKLSTELRVADGGNKHVGVVARSRGCARLELLSVMEYLTQAGRGKRALDLALGPLGEGPIQTSAPVRPEQNAFQACPARGASAMGSALHLERSATPIRWAAPAGVRGNEALARWRAGGGSATIELTRARGGKRVRGTLVCGVNDSDDGRRALELAVALSERLGLRLVLAHISDGIAPVAGVGDGAESVSMKANREGSARLLARLAAEYGVAHRAERRSGSGDAAAIIGQIAAEEAADLIVVGSSLRGRLRRGSKVASVSSSPVKRRCQS